MAGVKSNAEILVKRIARRINNIESGSARSQQALFRIGSILHLRTVLNIRKQGLVDTGALLNSIIFEVKHHRDSSDVTVASERIPYAAAHEFGFQGRVNVRAHSRMIRQVYGRSIKPKAIAIKTHTRLIDVPERAFMRPALHSSRPKIIEILRSLFIAQHS